MGLNDRIDGGCYLHSMCAWANTEDFPVHSVLAVQSVGISFDLALKRRVKGGSGVVGSCVSLSRYCPRALQLVRNILHAPDCSTYGNYGSAVYCVRA